MQRTENPRIQDRYLVSAPNKWLGLIMAIILDCLSGDRGSIPLRVAKQYFVSLMAERHFYIVTAVVRFHHEVPNNLCVSQW